MQPSLGPRTLSARPSSSPSASSSSWGPAEAGYVSEGNQPELLAHRVPSIVTRGGPSEAQAAWQAGGLSIPQPRDNHSAPGNASLSGLLRLQHELSGGGAGQPQAGSAGAVLSSAGEHPGAVAAQGRAAAGAAAQAGLESGAVAGDAAAQDPSSSAAAGSQGVQRVPLILRRKAASEAPRGPGASSTSPVGLRAAPASPHQAARRGAASGLAAANTASRRATAGTPGNSAASALVSPGALHAALAHSPSSSTRASGVPPSPSSGRAAAAAPPLRSSSASTARSQAGSSNVPSSAAAAALEARLRATGSSASQQVSAAGGAGGSTGARTSHASQPPADGGRVTGLQALAQWRLRHGTTTAVPPGFSLRGEEGSTAHFGSDRLAEASGSSALSGGRDMAAGASGGLAQAWRAGAQGSASGAPADAASLRAAAQRVASLRGETGGGALQQVARRTSGQGGEAPGQPRTAHASVHSQLASELRALAQRLSKSGTRGGQVQPGKS